MPYSYSKKHSRLAARRNDILAKDGELDQKELDELAKIARKIDGLPEAENYRRYLINKLDCSEEMKEYMRKTEKEECFR